MKSRTIKITLNLHEANKIYKEQTVRKRLRLYNKQKTILYAVSGLIIRQDRTKQVDVPSSAVRQHAAPL